MDQVGNLRPYSRYSEPAQGADVRAASEQARWQRIAGAYRAAWWLKAMAWTSLAIDVVSLMGTAVAFVTGAVWSGPSHSLTFATCLGHQIGHKSGF